MVRNEPLRRIRESHPTRDRDAVSTRGADAPRAAPFEAPEPPRGGRADCAQ